ncbi:hypothetical protein MANES_02G173800v8 [Manihot esculenta]|uniref:Uncharacterized protein n=1 Tax=Manihot esculenta TaxID=3983 RepID=A0A2C9WEU9_MANES|nr:hypothetical protein MANES_02G173800v8 [Manihot esculenta]
MRGPLRDFWLREDSATLECSESSVPLLLFTLVCGLCLLNHNTICLGTELTRSNRCTIRTSKSAALDVELKC